MERSEFGGAGQRGTAAVQCDDVESDAIASEPALLYEQTEGGDDGGREGGREQVGGI